MFVLRPCLRRFSCCLLLLVGGCDQAEPYTEVSASTTTQSTTEVSRSCIPWFMNKERVYNWERIGKECYATTRDINTCPEALEAIAQLTTPQWSTTHIWTNGRSQSAGGWQVPDTIASVFFLPGNDLFKKYLLNPSNWGHDPNNAYRQMVPLSYQEEILRAYLGSCTDADYFRQYRALGCAKFMIKMDDGRPKLLIHVPDKLCNWTQNIFNRRYQYLAKLNDAMHWQLAYILEHSLPNINATYCPPG